MEVPERFNFPFEPYSIQYDFMKCLYQVIDGKKLGIFESPTGTGKSLSIICGAVKWLKDHNEFERNHLAERVESLEKEKLEINRNEGDWLTSQAHEHELTRKINGLRLELNKIREYDRKIEGLKAKKHIVRKERQADKHDDLEPVEDDDDIVIDCVNEKAEEPDVESSTNKYQPTKIFICSRTHSQLSQFIGEILKSSFGQNLRVATLASRQYYCVNPNVNKLKHNSLINEKCLDIQKKTPRNKTDCDGKIVKKSRGVNAKCPFFKQSPIEDLKGVLLTQVQDVEDLVKSGQELKACPYYASRLAAEDAEVVLVPYNTILHRATREANGIDLSNNVVIIDEAHNLLEALAQMHNSDVSYAQIEAGLLQLKCYKQRFNTRFSAPNLLLINQLIFVLTKLQQLLDNNKDTKSDVFTVERFVVTAKIDNFNMFKLVQFCKNSHLAQKLRTYALKYPFDQTILQKAAKNGVKDFLIRLQAKPGDAPSSEEKPTLNVGNPLLSIIAFLDALTYSYSDGRIFIHANSDKHKVKLQFLLLNASQNFQDIVKEARSVIVAGGTMKPIEEFQNRLFINSGASSSRIVHFSCNHIIPPGNILPIVVTAGPGNEKLLFNYDHRMSMGASIKRVLLESCKVVQGGIVVFFPSYKYENWVWEQIKTLSFGRAVFREPQDAASVETVLKAYADAVKSAPKTGALLLSVVGGKLSEGLNFSDNLGRCVIVVGLPYANITAPDLKEKMSYLDKSEGVGSGKSFYEGLCMKAVNQSIGRAVRHINDYATILLLDERYNRTAIKNALPDFIRQSLKVADFQESFLHVKNFFEAWKRV